MKVEKILDEAVRSFDRAIIDFNTGVEKLFDVLNILERFRNQRGKKDEYTDANDFCY